MFYHPKDNKITIITKHFVFWLSLSMMAVLFLFSFHDEIKIPRREISQEIDIKNKVNICAPENPKEFKDSFLNF